MVEGEYGVERAGGEFLGRGAERAGVLDYELSERCGQAEGHDGSVGGRAGGWGEAVPAVEGRGEGGVRGEGLEGVLEGVLAVLSEGVSGECHGAGGV